MDAASTRAEAVPSKPPRDKGLRRRFIAYAPSPISIEWPPYGTLAGKSATYLSKNCDASSHVGCKKSITIPPAHRARPGRACRIPEASDGGTQRRTLRRGDRAL